MLTAAATPIAYLITVWKRVLPLLANNMTSHFKKALVALGILGIASAGGVANLNVQTQDLLINPYTDKGDVLEMTASNGDKIDVSKTEPSVTLQRWNGADSLGITYSEPGKSAPSRPMLTKEVDTPIDNSQTVTLEPTDDGSGFNVDLK